METEPTNVNVPRILSPITLAQLRVELTTAHGDWAKFLIRLYKAKQQTKETSVATRWHEMLDAEILND